MQFSLVFLFLNGTILRIEIIQFHAIFWMLFLIFFFCIGAFKWSIKPSQYIFYCVTWKSVRKNIDNAFVSESCNTEWIWHHLREKRRQKRVDWFFSLVIPLVNIYLVFRTYKWIVIDRWEKGKYTKRIDDSFYFAIDRLINLQPKKKVFVKSHSWDTKWAK